MDQRNNKDSLDHDDVTTSQAKLPVDFFAWMDAWAQRISLSAQEPVAVAVSGGADSMALCHLMGRWCAAQGREFLVMTVDHGLRGEQGAQEAAAVAQFVTDLAGDMGAHKTLSWVHTEKPQTRIQEAARAARYDLMAQEMRARGINYLFTAHHQGDQAETFLFRLAKGSGLDGLAGMAGEQEFAQGLTLCRPLLGHGKADLLAYCAAQEILFMHDPSNDQERFSRVRLRGVMDVLAREGLSEKRLAVTARRMARAREALEWMAREAFKKAAIKNETDEIVFDFNALKGNPKEIVLRVIVMAIDEVAPAQSYGVRMEKTESLVDDLLKPFAFRKRTLGKVIFTRDDANGVLSMTREHENCKEAQAGI